MAVSKKTGRRVWVRPSDWLPMPTVLSSEDKFVGLVAVFDNDSNFIAFTATSNFTVDWGDGSSTENIASGVTAQHKYTYSSISSSTLSSRGYRQAIITVVPQATFNLLSVNLDKRHSSASAQIQTSPWLDIICSCNNSSTGGFTSGNTVSRGRLLERVIILNGSNRTSASNMFSSCSSLTSVPLFNTSAVTNFTGMFSSCSSLTSVPLFNTSAGTNFTNMFATCSSLTSIPLFNTAAGTTFTSMFSSCSSLTSVPLFNTSAGTTFTSMFNGCSSLTSVPLFNTSAGTTFTSMFNGCSSLTSVPLFNTAAGTTFTTMFFNCPSLSRVLSTGFSQDISFLNCNLSGTALDEIYNALPVVVGKTITVTGNYGVATDNPIIATAKGWTVTG